MPPGDSPDERLQRRRVARLLASGLFDAEFHAALRGRSFPDDHAAARDYITWGMPRELPPNPFLHVGHLPAPMRRAWRRGRVRELLDWLESPEGRAQSWGPLFDPPAGEAWPPPESARQHLLRTAAELAAQDASAGDPPETAADVAARQAELIDWEQARAGLPHRVAGRTTVVIPTLSEWRLTVGAVGSVLENSGDLDVEVVVVDNGSPLRYGLALAASFFGEERVRHLRLPHNLNFAGGSNVGFAAGTGDVVVFLNNDTYARRGWLTPLREALADPDVAGVQPLLLYPNETIQTAGTVWLADGPLPGHLLVGHPRDDGRKVEGERFEAVTGAAMALRAEDVARLEGFDPAYRNGFEDVDLCLRLRELRGGGFRVAPASVVTHFESRTPGRFDRVDDNRALFVRRWQGSLPEPDRRVYGRLGLEVEHVEYDDQPVPAPRSVTVRRRDPSPDRLRWSINLPSTGGHWGDIWGDTYFADALARALRGLGQDVVTRRRDAHQEGPTHLDDVALAIRGRYPIAPSPGKVNLLWVISHPDTVDPAEFEGFDRVFAASYPWSERMSRLTGREVTPLLQATEVVPSETPPEHRLPEAVFVGGRWEDRDRPIVKLAVEAGIPLAVYGQGWEGHLPPGVWKGDHVPNDQLADLYRRHSLVLADHWPAMAEHGFIANRVFDAVAAGTPVACDPVAGLGEVFGGEVVVVWETVDLLRIVKASRATATGAIPLSVARRAYRDHSFVRRARVLVGHVPHLRSKVGLGSSARTRN